MTIRTRQRSFLLSIALACSTGIAVAAGSLPRAGDEGGLSAATKSESLAVLVTPGPLQLDPQAVREAIAAELAVELTSDLARPHWGEVTITGLHGAVVVVKYSSSDGSSSLERRVPLPVEPKRRALVISWVVGNLVRNEAAELLATMRQEPATSKVTETTVAADAAAASSEPSNVTSTAEVASATATDAPSQPAAPQAAVTAPIRPQKTAGATPLPAAAKLPVLAKVPQLEQRVIQLSLWSPNPSLYPDAQRYRFYLNLGGVYNRIGGVNGIGFTWLVDRNDVDLTGVQISGLWSQGHDSDGVLLSGAGSYASGRLTGAEISGAVAWRTGCMNGLQLSGALAAVATASKSTKNTQSRPDECASNGVQLSGAMTYAGNPLNGLQLSGAVAYAGSPFNGVQLAGATNVVRGTMSGLQLSPAVNIVTEKLRGAQLSGALNYSNEVSGLQFGVVNVAGRVENGGQFGVVNVATENHGFAFGLFNWSHQVRIQPQYYYETPRMQNLGVRFLTGYSTGSIAIGYDEAKDRFRSHYAFGGHLPFWRFAADAEVGYGWVLERFTHAPRDRAHELDLRGSLAFEILPGKLSVFGGAVAALPVAGLVANELDYRMITGVTLF